MIRTAALFACTVLTLNLAQPAAAQIVDQAQFRCLVRNIEQVPSEARGVYVNIEHCVEEGRPRVRRNQTPPPPPPPNSTVRTVVIDSVEHACIVRFRRNLGRITQSLPGGRYRLRLTPCGG